VVNSGCAVKACLAFSAHTINYRGGAKMSKNSKFATISVAVFVGLFAVYLGGYQTGKSANPSTDTEQATLATPDAPVLAQTTERQSSGEEPSPQLAAIDPQDVDPADIDWAAMRRSRDARGH
jgi:hypothetical protein